MITFADRILPPGMKLDILAELMERSMACILENPIDKDLGNIR